MRIERIDPSSLDLAIAGEMAEVANVEDELENPKTTPQSAEGLLLRIKYGHDMTPYEGLWSVRDGSGRLTGWGSLELMHWDNPQLAFVFADVRPDCRGQGVGTMILEAQIEAAKECARSSLLTFIWKVSYGARFLVSHDFTVGQHNAQRRLKPAHLDYENIERLSAQAAEHAADYELIRLDGPASPEMLPEIGVLFEAINDAPLDDVSMEPDVFPLDRIRRYDEAMAARRQHVYRLMARHRVTGDWAGHTILCVDGTRPGFAAQEDTSVIHQHRGHRLGMLLKANMLLWMREAEPGLQTIDTWNATSNEYMIAVNEALGCEVSGARCGVAARFVRRPRV